MVTIMIITQLQDPLEQFAIGQFLIYDARQLPELALISDRCPFNLIKIVKNLYFILFYLVAVSYYTVHQFILLHLAAPLHVILLWFIVAAIAVNLVVFDKIVITPILSVNNQSHLWKNAEVTKFLIKMLASIVKSVLKANTSLLRKEYFSVLYYLFLFILFSNMFGLVPYTFTLTSSFIVTFFFASTHFVGINVVGVYKKKIQFLNIFLPSGVPIFIAPFLVIIELISYIAKVFSLSIRLFANMMSGHALLKILIGFSWTMLAAGGVFYGLAIIPWVLVTAIMFLELLIAFLQAYVFIVLVAIYINDVLSQH
jgi:ATP synthase subunit 6